MWVVCYSNCTWVGSSTVRTTQSHRAQQFAAVKAIASGRHSAGFPETVRRGIQTPVQGSCIRERAGAEKRDSHRACRIFRRCARETSSKPVARQGRKECVDRGL
jgi:hypothetical protein